MSSGAMEASAAVDFKTLVLASSASDPHVLVVQAAGEHSTEQPSTTYKEIVLEQRKYFPLIPRRNGGGASTSTAASGVVDADEGQRKVGKDPLQQVLHVVYPALNFEARAPQYTGTHTATSLEDDEDYRRTMALFE